MLVESLDGYGVFTTDMEGRITSWNKGAEYLFGYEKKEVIKKHASVISTSEDKKLLMLKRQLKKVLKKGSLVNERNYLKKDGVRFWATGIIFLLEDTRHAPRGFTFVLRDQEEQKQIEKRKDDFISTATHELKTPITSMKLFAEVVGRNAKKTGDKVGLQSVEQLNKQLDRLVTLMDYLLDVSKIQQGRLKLEKHTFNINKLIEELILTIQIVTPLHTIIQRGAAPKAVMADRERIIQVLTNLLTNAIKYSPKGGEIIVASKQNMQATTISVQDFGFGISEAEQTAVFDRFYRASSATENNINGIGLGLYIVEKIVQAHRGKVWVESARGRGSTFYFSIPQHTRA